MSKHKPLTRAQILARDWGVQINPARDIRSKLAKDEKLTAYQEARLTREYQLRERVRLMRPYFGDTFKAGEGFHLSYANEWTTSQKKKVDKYWQVMAPLVSRPHVTRRYTRPDHLQEAIIYTQQEALLKGQTKALFDMNREEKLTVRFSRAGAIKVERSGVNVRKVFFDPVSLVVDPMGTVTKAVEKLGDATRFKLIMGAHESRGYFKSLDAMLDGIAKLQSLYSDDEYDSEDEYSHFFGNWLFGVVGYYGRPSVVDKRADKEREAREIAVAERQKTRAVERRERRAKMLLRPSKRARITGKQ